MAIQTRLRAEKSALVDYLLSRSNAGTTHSDLIEGIEQISHGAVTGRFFHMYPKRAFQLTRWLTRWIKKGSFLLVVSFLSIILTQCALCTFLISVSTKVQN